MTIEDILNDARSVVKKVVPDHVEITQVDFEGPTIVIYTKNMEVFAESNDLVRQIAQQLRRRIVVRPDPSLLAPQDEAEKGIREVILPEAQITGIYFEPETGEVTIEALSPGVVIGRHGSVLNEIKKKIGWAPKVVRTPPIPSKTVEEIRQYLRTINDERQSFLKQVGRRLAREVPQGENYVRITALGGFRQVGVRLDQHPEGRGEHDPAEVRGDDGHRARRAPHVPERGPHPRLRGRPLPHRRRPIQRRDVRRYQIREDLALQPGGEQVPAPGDPRPRVDVRRLSRRASVPPRCRPAAEGGPPPRPDPGRGGPGPRIRRRP